MVSISKLGRHDRATSTFRPILRRSTECRTRLTPLISSKPHSCWRSGMWRGYSLQPTLWCPAISMASLGLAHKITTIQRASLIGSRQGRRGRGRRFLTSDMSFPMCSSSASLSEIASSSSSPPRTNTKGKDSDEDLLVILSCRLRPKYYHAASGQILSCRPQQDIVMPSPAMCESQRWSAKQAQHSWRIPLNMVPTGHHQLVQSTETDRCARI